MIQSTPVDGNSLTPLISNLRHLLERAKYDAPQALWSSIIEHIEEDNSYEFFRFVEDLIANGAIDDLLRMYDDIWATVRLIYAERFPRLDNRTLETDDYAAKATARRAAIEKAKERAWKGDPSHDYKEDWITEELKKEGLSWEDVQQGYHLFRSDLALRAARIQLLKSLGIIEHIDKSAVILPDEDAWLEPFKTRYWSTEEIEMDIPEEEPRDDGKEGEISVTELTNLAGSFTGDEKNPTANAKPATTRKFLATFLEDAAIGTADDLNQIKYNGWIINSPLILLLRIANFLADEDIDRTADWTGKMAEITQYLSWLTAYYNRKKNSFGDVLREVMEMLNVHVLYENYHYSHGVLNLTFDVKPEASTRLPPTEGPAVRLFETAAARLRNDKTPRKLLHRVPQGVVDIMYRLPKKALEAYLSWFLKNQKVHWDEGSSSRHWNRRIYEWDTHAVEGLIPFGFNADQVEDDTFIQCMRLGPLRTSWALKTTCSFTYDVRTDLKSHEDLTRQIWHFSRFRGANRAGLTMVLRAFGSQTREIRALDSPYRKLILPTAREMEAKRRSRLPAGIVWDSLKYDKPQDDVDSLKGYVFWHAMLVKNNAMWARKLMPELRKYAETRYGKNIAFRPPLPWTNFRGPFIAVGTSADRYNSWMNLKRLKSIENDLKTAARLYPRFFITDMLVHVQWGREETPMQKETYLWSERAITAKTKVPMLLSGQDWELTILERLSHRSTNEFMLEPVPDDWTVEKRIFTDRVQALVHDSSGQVCFDKGGVTIKELLEQVNRDVGGPVSIIPFTDEGQAQEYLGDLENYGRIRIEETPTGALLYHRPDTTLHPEDTIVFLSTALAMAPSPRTYQEVLQASDKDREEAMILTRRVVRGAAWRLGYTIEQIEQTLANASEYSEEWREGFRSAHRELTQTLEQMVEGQRDLGGEQSSPEQTSPSEQAKQTKLPAGRPMQNKDVIKLADPKNYQEEWNDDSRELGDEGGIDQAVAENMVTECNEYKNPLWPLTAETAFTTADGSRETIHKHEALWGWALPEVRGQVRGPIPRYFDINRWPVELQKPETQREIRREGSLVDADVIMADVTTKNRRWRGMTQGDVIMVDV